MAFFASIHKYITCFQAHYTLRYKIVSNCNEHSQRSFYARKVSVNLFYNVVPSQPCEANSIQKLFIFESESTMNTNSLRKIETIDKKSHMFQIAPTFLLAVISRSKTMCEWFSDLLMMCFVSYFAYILKVFGCD